MFVIISLIFVFVFSPLLGFLATYFGFTIYPFYELEGWEALDRVLFVCLFFLPFFIFLRTEVINNVYFPDVMILRLYLKRLFLLCFFCTGYVFWATGYDFIFMDMDRGGLRTGHGILGPVYRAVLGYLLPAISVLTGFFYASLVGCRVKSDFFIVFLILLLLFLASVFTGYKGVFLYLVLPFFASFWFLGVRYFKFILLVVFLALFLICMTSIVRGVAFGDALNFLWYRVVYMTAYGDVAFLSSKEHLSPSFIYVFNNLFGSHITDLVFGFKSVLDRLGSNLSVAVSYLVYPDKDKVLSGTTNVTVTFYSEAVFLLGRFSFFYAFFSGCLVAFLLRYIRAKFLRNKALPFSLGVAYLFSSVIPWLNSGSIFNLFSLFVAVYIVFSFVILYFFVFRMKPSRWICEKI